MNWNIYFQAFTVRTWRKRLSNLNTFLTPHIYWGIHITICVNYNQHMAATTRERYIKGAERKMTILLWLWRLEEFCLKTELMFYIQELQMITFLLLSGQGWQMRQKWIFLLSFHFVTINVQYPSSRNFCSIRIALSSCKNAPT